MNRHIAKALVLILLTGNAFAGKGTEVSNINCHGTWIRSETDKLELLSACGKPTFSEVVSGENHSKLEGLLYQLNGNKYVIYLNRGKVVKIEWLR